MTTRQHQHHKHTQYNYSASNATLDNSVAITYYHAINHNVVSPRNNLTATWAVKVISKLNVAYLATFLVSTKINNTD